MQLNRWMMTGAALLLAAACGDGPDRVGAPPPPSCAHAPGLALGPSAAVVPLASPFDSLFAVASYEYGLPGGLLRAIGYAETRWQMVEGRAEFEGQAPVAGVMALGGTRLSQSARLSGLDVASIRSDPAANIRAAAALLRHHAERLGVADPAADWSPVVAAYSGIGLPQGREAYAREVASLRTGRRIAPSLSTAGAGTDDPCATPVPPAVDHLGAAWRTSPNFNQRMDGDGGRIHMVIIHSCEGGYVGCWSWLANRESQVSAHYVVREDGAEVTQLVRESARAWHIGATYDSTLNAGHDPQLHGVQSNHFTIGVEHAGFASQTEWPAAQLEASARLVCGAARRWGIPRDRLHIVAHGQLQPWNRTDPGQHWPWADYLERIERHCA